MTLCVVGAGGHGKVVLATARAAGYESIVLLDDGPQATGHPVLGHSVEGGTDRLADYPDAEVVLAIGNNDVRRRLAGTLPVARWGRLVHPAATVHDSVCLGPGTVVFAGAVIQPNTRIGAHVIVNTAATIDHDGEIGDYVHVAPGAHLAGGVRLGDGVLMGTASAAIPYTSVGAWTTVGGGGVVVQDLPGHVTAVGVPARPPGAT